MKEINSMITHEEYKQLTKTVKAESRAPTKTYRIQQKVGKSENENYNKAKKPGPVSEQYKHKN